MGGKVSAISQAVTSAEPSVRNSASGLPRRPASPPRRPGPRRRRGRSAPACRRRRTRRRRRCPAAGRAAPQHDATARWRLAEVGGVVDRVFIALRRPAGGVATWPGAADRMRGRAAARSRRSRPAARAPGCRCSSAAPASFCCRARSRRRRSGPSWRRRAGGGRRLPAARLRPAVSRAPARVAAALAASLAAFSFFSRSCAELRNSKRSRAGRRRPSRARGPRSRSWRSGSSRPAGCATGTRRRSSRTRCSRRGGIPAPCRSSGAREPVQLEGLQIGRAGLGALAAADAGHLGRRRREQRRAADQHAVGGLDHRHVEGRHGNAHHRAAHDEAVGVRLRAASATRSSIGVPMSTS
jgi:hypothetical protein